jgi:hypothetical protein
MEKKINEKCDSSRMKKERIMMKFIKKEFETIFNSSYYYFIHSIYDKHVTKIPNMEKKIIKNVSRMKKERIMKFINADFSGMNVKEKKLLTSEKHGHQLILLENKKKWQQGMV